MAEAALPRRVLVAGLPPPPARLRRGTRALRPQSLRPCRPLQNRSLHQPHRRPAVPRLAGARAAAARGRGGRGRDAAVRADGDVLAVLRRRGGAGGGARVGVAGGGGRDGGRGEAAYAGRRAQPHGVPRGGQRALLLGEALLLGRVVRRRRCAALPIRHVSA